TATEARVSMPDTRLGLIKARTSALGCESGKCSAHNQSIAGLDPQTTFGRRTVSRPPRSKGDAAMNPGCQVEPGPQLIWRLRGVLTQRWSRGCQVCPAPHALATSISSGAASCES